VLLDVVELVRPSKQDTVKVVAGPHKGYVGKLISVDGADGVLSGGMVVDTALLGKLAAQ
jgi:transcription elongation factor SPT5